MKKSDPIKSQIKVREDFYCPITHLIMVDPVIAEDGYTYERTAIEDWFSTGKIMSPMTNEPLQSDKLTENRSLHSQIQAFLSKHLELYEQDEVYRNPKHNAMLIDAIKNHDEANVQRFLDKDPRLLTTILVNNRTAFHLASELGNFELVKRIGNRLGENLNYVLENNPPGWKPVMQNQRIHDCILNPMASIKFSKGSQNYDIQIIQCIQEAVRLGGDINNIDLSTGRTVIQHALFTVHRCAIVKFLLTQPGIQFYASKGEKDIVAQVMIDNWFWSSFSDNQTRQLVFELMEHPNFNIDAIDNLQETPLISAARYGRTDALKKLIVLGANLNHKNYQEQTALHFTIIHGHSDCARILIEADDIDINCIDSLNGSILYYAAAQNVAELIPLVLSRMQDEIINEGLYGHQTPLHIAVINGHINIVKNLLDDARIDTLLTSHGQQAIHLAAIHGHKEIVELLLASGIDVNSTNAEGKCPAILAEENNHIQLGHYLKHYLLRQHRIERARLDELEQRVHKQSVVIQQLSKLIKDLVGQLAPNHTNIQLDNISEVLDTIIVDQGTEQSTNSPLDANKPCISQTNIAIKSKLRQMIENTRRLKQGLRQKAGMTIKMVDKLVLSGAEITQELLELAIRHAHIELVDHFINKYQLDIHYCGKNVKPYLLLAAESGSILLFDRLVKQYDLQLKTDEYGKNALHYAAEKHHVNLMEHLIEKYKLDINSTDYGGRNLLSNLFNLSISNYMIDPIEKFIKKYGEEIHMTKHYNDLMPEVAECGSIFLFDYIVEKAELDPKSFTDEYDNPLLCTVRYARIDLFRHLVRRYDFYYEPGSPEYHELLMLANDKENMTVVFDLFGMDFSHSSQDELYQLILKVAEFKSIEFFDCVIAKIPQVDIHTIFDHDGNNCLLKAAQSRCVALFDHLVDAYQMDPFVTNHHGYDAFVIASQKESIGNIFNYKSNSRYKTLTTFYNHLMEKYKFDANHSFNKKVLDNLFDHEDEFALYCMIVACGDTFNLRCIKDPRWLIISANRFTGNRVIFDHIYSELNISPEEREKICYDVLHTLAARCNVNLFQHLVEFYHLSPHVPDRKGNSVLKNAVIGIIQQWDHRIRYLEELHNPNRYLYDVYDEFALFIHMLLSEYRFDMNDIDNKNLLEVVFEADNAKDSFGQARLIEIIIDYFATALRSDNYTYEMLEYAVVWNNVRLFDHIAQQLAFDFRDKDDGKAFLFSAVKKGNNEIIDRLVDHYNIDIHVRNMTGESLLIHAVEAGHCHTVDLLIEKYGLNVAETDIRGYNLLLRAIVSGRVHVFEHLLTKYRLDINSTPIFDRNVLFVAVCSTNPVLLIDHLITKHQFDINIADSYGFTILMKCAELGKKYLFDHLVKTYSLDITKVDHKGRNALAVARDTLQTDMAEYLSNHYYNSECSDESDTTANQNTRLAFNEPQFRIPEPRVGGFSFFPSTSSNRGEGENDRPTSPNRGFQFNTTRSTFGFSRQSDFQFGQGETSQRDINQTSEAQKVFKFNFKPK